LARIINRVNYDELGNFIDADSDSRQDGCGRGRLYHHNRFRRLVGFTVCSTGTVSSVDRIKKSATLVELVISHRNDIGYFINEEAFVSRKLFALGFSDNLGIWWGSRGLLWLDRRPSRREIQVAVET
jgi:hypothetical protein